MHEVSMANSIVELVEKSLPADTESQVTAVQIKVGELSAIEPEALLFSFDIVKNNTRLANAVLNIEIIEGRGQCSDCDTEFSLHTYATPCPHCNSYLIKIMQGKEMKIVSFDLED